MSIGTTIQWTDATVNPVPGCRRISEGCGTHEGGCYAEKMAWRLAHNPATPQYHGTVRMTGNGPRWTGKVGWAPSELDKIRAWKKPRRIFVESMGDLFFDEVPREHVDAIFTTMEACPQHTFQVLTKRARRMAAYVTERYAGGPVPAHIWLGTSVESQAAADERIPHLLRCNAAVRWLSCEPLLEAVDLNRYLGPQCANCGTYGEDVPGVPDGPDDPSVCTDCGGPVTQGVEWIVVGGESGRKARAFDVAWARSLVAQCRAAGVAVFVKQLGANPVGDLGERPEPADGKRRLRVLDDSHGGDVSEWPADLNVRQFPEVAR
jgi:protein gp37